MKNLIIILTVICSQISFGNSLKENIEKLSSEEFGGRKPGTEEIDKAAEYIKSQFENAGLKPLGDSWYQEFKVKSGKKLAGENKLSFNIYIPRPGIPKDKLRPRTATWETLEEWTPMPFSSDGEYEGEMVFVGYGISSEELGYDDYSGVDVEGKAVIIVGNSPDGESRTGDFARYASWRYKTSNAKEHKAAAIIFIKPPMDSANVMFPLDQENRLNTNAGIPAIQVSREKFIKYFPKGKGLLKLEEQIASEKKPSSIVIENKEVSLKVGLEDIEFTTKNIIGFLEGDSDEYIFIGAHYDHLGTTNTGSSRYRESPPKIHPGADDNASGTAAIIEIADRLKKNDMQHSIIFAAWSAEEMGLLGSDDFLKNYFELEDKVKCYINFDMVGRLKDAKLSILGVGTSPEFSPAIAEASSNYNFNINEIQSGMGPSDHASFYKGKMPVLALFSGIHSDYHTPEDTPDKINYNGLDSIIDFSIDLIDILDSKSEIAFSEVKQNEKAQKIRRGSSKVIMGVIPNYSDIDHGFIIDGVKPGGPAAIGGLKGGDIIVEIDGDKINDIYDFMYSYWDKNPGEVVAVKVLRDNNKEPITLNIKLAAKDY